MQPTCRSCYYYWYKGLTPWCFEPTINRKLRRPEGVCRLYQDAHKKFMPGKKKPGRERLPFD